MLTPDMAPRSRAHMPAQLTTTSLSIRPLSSPDCQETPVTRPSSRCTAVTLTPSTIDAPRRRAPLASAWAMLAGSHWPSRGRCTAPTTSATLRWGYMALTSAAVTSSTSTPKARASEAVR